MSRRLRWFNKKNILFIVLLLCALVALSFGVFQLINQGVKHSISSFTEAADPATELIFDESVTGAEQNLIKDAVKNQEIDINESTNVSVITANTVKKASLLTQIFVPVTNFNSVRQNISTADASSLTISVLQGTDAVEKNAVATLLGLDASLITEYSGELKDIPEESIVFIPIDSLSYDVKLLSMDSVYYLDSFNSGAIFREAAFFNGEIESNATAGLKLVEFPQKDAVLKMNVTGVTALTRIMMRKLNVVGDPLYFSEKIGTFLADADITHVSNEVSFRDGCTYSDTSFCSPPPFIETLKASGVDVVELTGNHNNDQGSDLNTTTINTYHQLGWATVGGGLNTVEAAKPYSADQKGSKVTMLAYNYPDSPNGGAIAGTEKAGANSFNFDRIAEEIKSAKSTSDIVMVNVQYWECYAYPDGYVEYPVCDKPIGKQEADFKKLIDLGADIVVGSSAHQPQTYELYNGKPIYYGLGNLYFDQTEWPGTERGIVLTHYFVGGKLKQTKLTPTEYDKSLQTRISTPEEAEYLLSRLHDAR